MMRLILAMLFLLSTTAIAATLEGFKDSQQLGVDPLVLFHNTYRAHFKKTAAEIRNWKGMNDSRFERLVPSKDLQEKTYLAVVKNAHRFWKGRHAEMMLYGIAALILSESNGVNRGNPSDPSFGLMHVTCDVARSMSDAFGFFCPEKTRDIRRKLSKEVDYNILVGVSELAVSMSSFDETPRYFPRGIMAYKMGLAGATRWLNTNQNKGMAKLDFIAYYQKCLSQLLVQRQEQLKLLKGTPNGTGNRP